MKICFFGVGGVGGYFGSLVTKKLSAFHEIYFVARGAHKDAICKNGLTLKKSGGTEIITATPKICTDTIEEIPVCDIIIVSVKSYDLIDAVRDIAKICDDNTVILPLLNGVDICERKRNDLHCGKVLPSCVYVGTHIESPGVIFQKGGNCKILIGKDPLFPNFYPKSLLNLLTDSKIDFGWEENVYISIWSKYMFIAAYGLVTAAYKKTLGEILENQELRTKVKAIMQEIYSIALANKIPLSKDVVEKSFLKAQQFPYQTKTSFQRDVEQKGCVNESDLYAGTLIRFGKELGIATQNTEAVYKLLRDNLSL